MNPSTEKMLRTMNDEGSRGIWAVTPEVSKDEQDIFVCFDALQVESDNDVFERHQHATADGAVLAAFRSGDWK